MNTRALRSAAPFILVPATLAALTGWVAGCSGTVTPATAGATSTASTTSGSSTTSTSGSSVGSSGTTWSPVCPIDEPTEGEPCALDGTPACEYGFTPTSIGCDKVYVCMSGSWQAVTPGDLGDCRVAPPANPASCPATYAAVPQGSSCSDDTLSCWYSESEVCGCLSDPEQPNSPSSWTCLDNTSGCPADRPRVGTACGGAADDASCTYNQLCSIAEECNLDGIWVLGGGGCGG